MRLKQTIAGLTAGLLLFCGTGPAAWGADADWALRTEHDPYLYEGSLAAVDSIDLPMVLKRAVEDSDNVKLLTLKYAAQSAKEDDLLAQRDELAGGVFTGGHLPETPEELTAGMAKQGVAVDPSKNLWLGPMTTVTNKAVNQLIQGMGAMTEGMNEIILSQREQMKTAAHQLNTDQKNTQLQLEEAREGIRLQTIAQYTRLLGMKQQLAVMNEYTSVLEREATKAKLFLEQGLASEEDVRTADKALAGQKDDVKTLEQSFRLALVQLSFDIGIAYNPNLIVKEIEDLNAAAVPVERTSTMTLLKQSYQMKMSAYNMDEAFWQTQNTVTKNTYGNTYLNVNQGIAAAKNSQTQQQLTQKIEATYSEAEQGYQTLLAEQRKVRDIQTDLKNMRFRHQVGVISALDLRKFELKVSQSEAAFEATKLKYYVLREKALAMNKGFIS